MDDDTAFRHIFAARPSRASDADRLRIRDGNLIAELKALIRALAAADARTGGGWTVDFSAVRHDLITERSMFEVALSSAERGDRRLNLRVAQSYVEMGGAAMESSIRDERNLHDAVEIAFRRIIGAPASPAPDGAVRPATSELAGA